MPSPRERWAEVERLLDRLLNLPPADRADYLSRACPNRPGVRAEVEALLRRCDEHGFLDESVQRLAAPLPQQRQRRTAVLAWRQTPQ
jgi:serine/threonine-protein kinase